MACDWLVAALQENEVQALKIPINKNCFEHGNLLMQYSNIAPVLWI